MTTEVDLVGLQFNDESYSFVIFYGATPLNLTNLTLTFYLKESNMSADDGAYTNTPTVTSALLGEFTVQIPRGEIYEAGTRWYRVDALNTSGFISTLVFGVLNVLSV